MVSLREHQGGGGLNLAPSLLLMASRPSREGQGSLTWGLSQSRNGGVRLGGWEEAGCVVPETKDKGWAAAGPRA